MAGQPLVKDIPRLKDVSVRGERGRNYGRSDKQAAPQRKHLYVGVLGDRVHRSFLDFNIGGNALDDVGTVLKAELVLTTSHADFEPGGAARVVVFRCQNEWQEETNNTDWGGGVVNPGFFTTSRWVKDVDRNINDATFIDITHCFAAWLPKSKKWMGNDGVIRSGRGRANHGVMIRATDEDERKYSCEFHSGESNTPGWRPYIHLTYLLPNRKPDDVTILTPRGTVAVGTLFSGEHQDPNNDRPETVKIFIRKSTGKADPHDEDWVKGFSFPFDITWPEVGGRWTWSGAESGLPALKNNIEYNFRAQTVDPHGAESDQTGWVKFKLSGTAPSVSLVPMGTLDSLVGKLFVGRWTIDSAAHAVSYRIQLKRSVDPWTLPLWDAVFIPITTEEMTPTAEAPDGQSLRPYSGPDLVAGAYDWRMLVVDSAGVASGWSVPDVLTLTVGSEPDLDDPILGPPANSTGFARERARVRIVLRDKAAGRGPGKIVAVIEDAANIGMSAYANDPGELYFTLPATHPQAGMCEPYQTHYALQQYRNGNWFDVANGILTDFDAGDDDIIVYGMDYLGLLSISIDTRFPVNDKSFDKGHADGGAKYNNKTISHIITDQLDEARTDSDSPTGFIHVGNIDTLGSKITIYSSFVQRLSFIKSLIQSHRQGTGIRTRLKARFDRVQKRWEWDLRAAPGQDRDNLTMTYGSLVQGFRVIGMGDFGSRAHGIGRRPLSVKPIYFMFPPDKQSNPITDTFGNIQKVNVWEDIIDRNDLQRRVKQIQAESSKVGKRVALGIRVHGINPFDGYDITDNFPLHIDRGAVETIRYGSGYWTIWGIEWRVFPDGHDELTWSILPREDSTPPNPDLIPSDPVHDTGEWLLGNGPPVEEDFPDDFSGDLYMDMDTGIVYERIPGSEPPEWVPQGSLEGPEGPAGSEGAPGPEGPPGEEGPPGSTGPPGATGPPGSTGPPGPAGADGSAWLSGVGAPAGALGSVGDFYLNEATGDVYEKTGTSTWVLISNLEGPQGPPGSQGPGGASGTPGAPGSIWYNGAGAPSGALGVVGDFYLNNTTGDVYKKTGASTWTIVANIKGPQGPQGPTGPYGPTPADGLVPPNVANVVVTPLYTQQSDGTDVPVLSVTWTILTTPDIIGYEVEWDDGFYTNPGSGDVYTPADWVSARSMRVGRDRNYAALAPVLGGVTYDVRVRAYDMEGKVSAAWTVVTQKKALPDSSAPSIPTVAGYGGYMMIGASWDANNELDFSHYEVGYRLVQVPVVDYKLMDTRSTRIVINGLPVGTYEMRVRATDHSGNVRNPGTPPTIPPFAVPPTDPTYPDVGWSNVVSPVSSLVGQSDVVFNGILASIVSATHINADDIKAGTLSVGGGGDKTEGLRIFNPDGEQIGAWGDFGWIIADPHSPNDAIWSGRDEDDPSGELGIFFSHSYIWDGKSTSPIEGGIQTSQWQAAITPRGINAEAILFGSVGGGSNRMLNASMELQAYPTAAPVEKAWDNQPEWATVLASGRINLDVSTGDLKMTAT